MQIILSAFFDYIGIDKKDVTKLTLCNPNEILNPGENRDSE
jgi:hypothetical protein